MGKVTARSTYEPQSWRHRPTVVRGIFFDGTEACAEAIMAWAPGKFVLDDYDRLCTLTPEGLRYVHEGSTAMLDVEGLPYSVREAVMALAYVQVTPDYRAPLTADRVRELHGQAHLTTDIDTLRGVVDQLVAHSEALQA